jgi:hypothetical protein
MWCPRCDQGNVKRMKITATNETVHICEECDALWLPSVKIASTGFVDFHSYMVSIGRQGLWSELEEIRDAKLTPHPSNEGLGTERNQ